MLNGYEIHPLAAIFPMLSEEELSELADDITTNGLLHPIVRTLEGVIVDGRNRLAACEIAGVEPEFEDRIVDDDEARALIVSANLQRRHLTKGQQAMALAMIYPQSTAAKGGRGKKDATANLDVTSGFSAKRLQLARAVLRHDPDLAGAVLSGAVSLDNAHSIVKTRQQEASSTEARLARLRQDAPDLADLVTEERMTVSEAVAASAQRAEERRIAIEAARRVSETRLLDLCTSVVTLGAGYELGERGLVSGEHLARLKEAMALLHRYYNDYEETAS